MIYFLSDLHLGLPNFEKNLPRERKIVAWLDEIKANATDIYFLGDVFEFWYEWKDVIPKHFSRFFGKLAELADMGIKLHYFTGNHDIWAYGYFEQEFGMKIHRKPAQIQLGSLNVFLAHGDGLGPNDKKYKLLKKVFTNKILQWSVSTFFHPTLIFKFARKISYKRDACNKKPEFKGDEEWLIQFAKSIEQTQHFDYYIFGHRHISIKYEISKNSSVIILGDWIKKFTYAEYDGNQINIKKYLG